MDGNKRKLISRIQAHCKWNDPSPMPTRVVACRTPTRMFLGDLRELNLDSESSNTLKTLGRSQSSHQVSPSPWSVKVPQPWGGGQRLHRAHWSRTHLSMNQSRADGGWVHYHRCPAGRSAATWRIKLRTVSVCVPYVRESSLLDMLHIELDGIERYENGRATGTGGKPPVAELCLCACRFQFHQKAPGESRYSGLSSLYRMPW